ncbi:uncharacterized protein LOC120901826 isoform X1 [Anopheles arabiensis]|uniref:uncharacterized protein LOC120901826 isoform X1 n=1 Tax=Anopheles arabiensis TaxID=7173 RepID=UPI001AAC9251|nr:uncharacterized protein LOC120901826 isoform X1 [Anopheles arabiensis]XP_040166056.1 uncharacterized protein LOC120901826 isoform X1 [Anopheles arabiensis]XP_040166057.1 uncharacterized protein LOC120901826 isoform X1 [Anopheles arabiensis]XP_040166059.1 uncharacterized protein LOC120901826 isoform X1 [Anopheles arabiensis]XP_040166060.1 uncharacterized protein LOC120901826 isoform X1 [Anopheles arabiensis]XP_061516768.1 uncharacterized protein LOC133393876 isoform X1 [Anopheles gambiae]XP
MSDKLTGGRYNRISPSSGRGSIIAYSPLPKSEQDCLQAPGNNCLAIPLSAIQTTADHASAHGLHHPINLAHANSLPVVGGMAGKLPNAGHGMVAHGDAQKHAASQQQSHHHHNNNINNNHNSNHNNGNNNNNNNANHNSSGKRFIIVSDIKKTVSFGGQPGSGGFVSSRSEPISLATLDKDCFIIPVHSLDRFLPAGIPQLPTPETADPSQVGPLSVLEVSDPKICILAHLMSPLEPIDPLLESPLAHPLMKQRAVASELLNEVQQGNNAVGGMLLANMERSSAEFPFIAYYVINTTQTDPAMFYTGVRGASLSKFEPKNTRYTAAHTLDLYSEVASICRPPLALAPNEIGSVKKGQTPSTGYIISVYKVYEGDDGERFERNWLYWTGARMIYRYLPKTAGLRRITLHKSVSSRGDKMYLLLCECADLLKDLSAAALLIPALRARLCGYTGLYRPIQTF